MHVGGNSDSLIATGGADAKVTLWRDATAEEAAQKAAEAATGVQQQQALANALQARSLCASHAGMLGLNGLTLPCRCCPRLIAWLHSSRPCQAVPVCAWYAVVQRPLPVGTSRGALHAPPTRPSSVTTKQTAVCSQRRCSSCHSVHETLQLWSLYATTASHDKLRTLSVRAASAQGSAVQAGDLLDAARLALDLKRPGNFLAIAKQALSEGRGEQTLGSIMGAASDKQIQVQPQVLWSCGVSVLPIYSRTGTCSCRGSACRNLLTSCKKPSQGAAVYQHFWLADSPITLCTLAAGDCSSSKSIHSPTPGPQWLARL